MSKYHARRTNGYASKREAARAGDLYLLERIGEISDLREQVSFDLLPPMPRINCLRPLRYVADFVYKNKAGERVVEDVKGFKTMEYRIKKRLMLHVHGIEITES